MKCLLKIVDGAMSFKRSFEMWEILSEYFIFIMYYVNILNVMDGTGTLECCKDLNLTLERDLDGINSFEQ